jgi:hypothetical protein
MENKFILTQPESSSSAVDNNETEDPSEQNYLTLKPTSSNTRTPIHTEIFRRAQVDNSSPQPTNPLLSSTLCKYAGTKKFFIYNKKYIIYKFDYIQIRG